MTRIRSIWGVTLFALTLLLTVAIQADGSVADGSGDRGRTGGQGPQLLVSAPSGWVLDSESSIRDNLHAIFHPAGSSWAKAPAVLYVNTVGKRVNENLEAFIAEDLSRFQSESSSVKMVPAPSIETSDKKRALVRYFSGDPSNKREAVAYIQEKDVFVVIVLTARTEESYKSALPAFAKLVQSYRFDAKTDSAKK